MRDTSPTDKDKIMKQYSKRTAIIHWLIFLLVVAALLLGH